jgi:chromosome segregation ATPase
MDSRSLEQRVETLEGQMNDLRALPARMQSVESQIVQQREESRGEFSAVRTEIREVRHELRIRHPEVRAAVEALRADVAELRAGQQELREDNRIGVVESQNYMRMLYEQLRADIRRLGEGRPPIS